jgi:hypothetical protein
MTDRLPSSAWRKYATCILKNEKHRLKPCVQKEMLVEKQGCVCQFRLVLCIYVWGWLLEKTPTTGVSKKGHSLLLPVLVTEKDYWPFVTKIGVLTEPSCITRMP